MVDIDQIRQAQEQRLSPVIKAWDDAKKHLEDAMALAKTREQEFHEVSEDVRRKLGALDLVVSMANGIENTETNRPVLVTSDEHRDEDKPCEPAVSDRGFTGLMRRSSRPLFPNVRRSA